MPVGPGDDASDRDPLPIGEQGAFGALLSTVYRGFAGGLPAAGSLDDAAIDNQVFQLEADDSVVGFEADLFKIEEDPGGDPFIPAASVSAGRAGGVADLFVGGAQDQDLDELVENHPVADAWTVTTLGVGDVPFRDQRLELVPEGLDDG